MAVCRSVPRAAEVANVAPAERVGCAQGVRLTRLVTGVNYFQRKVLMNPVIMMTIPTTRFQ